MSIFTTLKICLFSNNIQDNICREIPSKLNYVSTQNKKFSDEILDMKAYTNQKSTCEFVVGDDIPESVNEMGAKGMNHFFRAKIKKMQNDHERLQFDYKTKVEILLILPLMVILFNIIRLQCDELKKLQRETLKLEEEKEKWFQMSAGHKMQINKLESQVIS